MEQAGARGAFEPISEQTFTEKYHQYAEMLYRLCMVYLGNPQDAEEAVQEVFVRLLYKAPSFADGEHEKRWLLRVAVNLCKDTLKSGWRTRTVQLEEAGDFAAPGELQQDAALLVSLPAKYKAVLYLHYYEGYTGPEIAKMLGIGLSAVKMRLKRGRELLRMEMEAEKS